MRTKNANIGEADCIKAEFIDFLLNDFQKKYDLIVNEVPFLRANRWADLIAIYNGQVIGFEIKGERDNLNTLSEQLSDYIKVFNMVYLVLDEKFIGNPKLDTINKNIGLIIIGKDYKFREKRQAISKASLSKLDLITMLWRKDLEKLAPAKKGADIEILRNYVTKNCSVKTIQKQIIESLKSRYSDSYKLFLKDRGNYTTIEDIHTITRIKKAHALSNIDIV